MVRGISPAWAETSIAYHPPLDKDMRSGAGSAAGFLCAPEWPLLPLLQLLQ